MRNTSFYTGDAGKIGQAGKKGNHAGKLTTSYALSGSLVNTGAR
ncbi:hypothetical protein [Methanosarcina sp. DH2]|nr:hypothetical protein [Methanosarcina sp. DH2]